jgi:hypothetical protein
MTDPTDYDELLSRVLDDEATAEERARVATDGSLTARLELLRRTRERVAEPPPALDEATVDQLVARALRELPLVQAGPPPAAPEPDAPPAAPLAPVPPPTSLAAHREKRSRTPIILTAAAAILLVLLAVPVLALLAGDDDGDTASQDEVAQVDADSAADGAAEGGGSESADELTDVAALLRSSAPLAAMAPATEQPGRDEPATTVAPPGDGEEAEDDVPSAVFVPTPPPTDGDTDVVTWCRSQLATPHPELAEDDVRGVELTYQGQAAVAYLFEQDGADVVLVASAETCEVLEPPSPA